ncbi:hypothetical protein [Pseudoalteromonas 'SMAR']|uniref:hypothetical protein n=1 Tax=Pseudoalteromonas 'SMAR' TaxID=3416908 RepID=UPI003AF2815D
MPQNTKYVYHYTTTKGLEGIVKHRTLRFTDHRFLNDFGEFVRAYEKLKELEPKMQTMLTDLYKTLNASYSLAFFCVSKTCDSLAQMRLYGDDCRGAAIALSTNTWELASESNGRLFPAVKLFDSPNNSIFREPVFTQLEDCEYTDLDHYCTQIINNHKEFLNQLNIRSEGIVNLRNLSASEAEELFKFLADIAKWKDKSFSEEQEMRTIALVPKDNLLFESRANDIRPYWDWQTQGNNLDHLILGVILGAKCSTNTAGFLAYKLGSSNYSREHSSQIEWREKVGDKMFDVLEPANNYFCFKQKTTYQ